MSPDFFKSLTEKAVLVNVIVLAAGESIADIDVERLIGTGVTAFFEPDGEAGETTVLAGEATAGFEATVGVALFPFNGRSRGRR